MWIHDLDAVILGNGVWAMCPRHMTMKHHRRTSSGLWEAVMMTPTVFPSRRLLLRPARTPTQNRTESNILPLVMRMRSSNGERSPQKLTLCENLQFHRKTCNLQALDACL